MDFKQLSQDFLRKLDAHLQAQERTYGGGFKVKDHNIRFAIAREYVKARREWLAAMEEGAPHEQTKLQAITAWTEKDWEEVLSYADDRALETLRSALVARGVPVNFEALKHDLGTIRVGRLPTMNQDEYPGLGGWWVQLRTGSDGDEVLARVYGETPEQAHNRASALANPVAVPVAVPAAVPVSAEPVAWHPVNGDTLGYEGAVVLRHKTGDYRIAHSNWLGSHMVTPYPPSKPKEPAYVGTIDMGFESWMPLEAPVAAQAQPSGDRAMLLELMAAFDMEVWNCPNCTATEETKDCDSAIMLREYLANNPVPAQQPVSGADLLRDEEIKALDEAWKNGICHAVGEYTAAKIAWLRRAALAQQDAESETKIKKLTSALRDLVEAGEEAWGSDRTCVRIAIDTLEEFSRKGE